MKKPLLIAVLAALSLTTSLAWAGDDSSQHLNKDKKESKNITAKDQQLQTSKMQETMLQMHEQMHKIMASNNPQERERLTQEHTRMMQDNLPFMQGSHGTSDGHSKGSSGHQSSSGKTDPKWDSSSSLGSTGQMDNSRNSGSSSTGSSGKFDNKGSPQSSSGTTDSSGTRNSGSRMDGSGMGSSTSSGVNDQSKSGDINDPATSKNSGTTGIPDTSSTIHQGQSGSGGRM